MHVERSPRSLRTLLRRIKNLVGLQTTGSVRTSGYRLGSPRCAQGSSTSGGARTPAVERADVQASSVEPAVDVWVQVDTVNGLPQSGNEAGKYVVRARWEGLQAGQDTRQRLLMGAEE